MTEKQLKETIRGGYARPGRFFFDRPHVSRRQFFQLAGAGLTGSMLASPAQAGEVVSAAKVTPISKARNVVFILLSGAPSHVDTFDFKEGPSTPMDLLKPETINGTVWPRGILPKLADNLKDMAIIRSGQSWALQHNLAQVWAQIGRSPAAVLGDVAPNAGSIVAIEKEKERTSTQVFPAFLALNSQAAVGSGYLSAAYAPLKISPATTGLPDTAHPESGGQGRFDARYSLLTSLDGNLRTQAPNGRAMSDYGGFYEAGRRVMYNASVDQAFRFTAEESARYGSSGFGNACLLANKVLAANGGTRYIQITFGSWDHHQDIYDTNQANKLPRMSAQLDAGLAQMLNDMKSNGVLNETLVVVMGEFGRTVGAITGQNGRDHFLQQFYAFAGAGIKGGKVIGQTGPAGSGIVDFGWSGDRYIRPEDVEATIYSALGIDWTTVRYDDPFGRGFEYVYGANEGTHGPIHELWV
jgi:hypothetical protein